MTTDVTLKHVAPLYVLAVRRRLRHQSDVAKEIAQLLPKVASALTGPPMALAIGFPRDGLTDFDLAFPVAESQIIPGFDAQTLPALPMFSITHVGALANGPEGSNLSDTWNRFVEFVRLTAALLGDDPQRFIYHEGLDSVESEDERVTLEIQYAYHLPMWLDAFADGVMRKLEPEAAHRVLEGMEALSEHVDGKRAAKWIRAAIVKLDQEVADERSLACILNPCAHHYIVQSREILSALWDQSNRDLRKLVDLISAESALGSDYWIDESGSVPQLMIRRRPARLEAYNEATDPREKRYHACFCPLVRDAIRAGEPVSRSFCHCSGGWYVQEWETVFGVKPQVDLVETMVEGADSCLFAVRIPNGFLEAAS